MVQRGSFNGVYIHGETGPHTMRHSAMTRIFFLVLVVALYAPGLTAQASSCRPDDDTSAVMLSSYREIASAVTQSAVATRNALKLQATTAVNVTMVTDKRICDKMVAGLNSTLRTPGLSRQLYVIKIGNNYAVKDPDHPAGEWLPTVTFDKNGKFLAVVLAP